MKSNIVIVGSGQLGSRHLQGLADCKIPLNISVMDNDKNMLTLAKNRWDEVTKKSNIHAVRFMSSYNDISEIFFDVAIISTTSKGRANLITELSSNLKIRYWIIEKILAQSEVELDLIFETLKSSIGTWVNTPLRMNKWYQEIIASTPNTSPIEVSISGNNWGLGTNAIHFLDLVSWFSNEEIVSIQTDELEKKWIKSKREGYWECFGTLKADFSGGSTLVMKCNPVGDFNFFTDIKSLDYSWHIKDLEGIAYRSDGFSIPGKLDLQSEITGNLVELILTTGACSLPNIKDSTVIHRKLIKALLKNWNSVMIDKKVKLPIT